MVGMLINIGRFLNKSIELITGGGGGPTSPGDALLLEDGSYLLLEDGSKILLEYFATYVLLEDNASFVLLEDGSKIILE